MVKRKIGERFSRVASVRYSVAEARFKKIAENLCTHMSTELASDTPTSATADAFIDFLDRGEREVPVHPRKNGKIFPASCLDIAYKQLMIASPSDYQKVVVPYLTSPEGRLFLPYLYELKDAAIEIGIKWEQAEKVLRELLHGYSGRRSSPRPTRDSLRGTDTPRKSLKGERDSRVAARRVHLRQMMRLGARPTDIQICRRWDAERIPTPEAWQSKGISMWEVARKKIPNNLHKLISIDVSRIRKRN